MSLEQVNAFYVVLMSDQAIYEQYYNKCGIRGVFGIWSWDKTKIVNFATTLGYIFNEDELDAVWFGTELNFPEKSQNLLESWQLSILGSQKSGRDVPAERLYRSQERRIHT